MPSNHTDPPQTDAPPPFIPDTPDIPKRDVGDFIKEKLESSDMPIERQLVKPPTYYERIGGMFAYSASICMYAFLLKPGQIAHYTFSDNLKFRIECLEARSEAFADDPQWKNYDVNGEFVGNVWGMQKEVTKLCYEEFIAVLAKGLLKSW